MALNLKKFAKSEATKPKKDAIPTLELANSEENNKALKSIIEQKKIEKNAETLRKQSENVIRPQADKLREAHCQSTNQFFSSIRIKCGEVGPITYVNQHRYSVIGMDKEEELRGIFGEDYGRCFRIHTSVKLTDKGLLEAEKDDENGLLSKLVTACGGEEKFAELFEVEQTIEPTDFLHEQKIMDQKILPLSKKASELGIVKQSSSSFLI